MDPSAQNYPTYDSSLHPYRRLLVVDGTRSRQEVSKMSCEIERGHCRMLADTAAVARDADIDAGQEQVSWSQQ